MKPLSVGVIGCGMLARQIHLPSIVELGDTSLHTCCDLSEESLRACESFAPKRLSSDFLSVVGDPDVDLIVVATAEAFRVPIIEAAARAGKPVYCEKPLADSIDNALRIQQLVDESQIPFCVGHNRRCAPAMVRAHSLFRQHLEHPRPVAWRFEREGLEVIPVGPNPGAPFVSIRINDDWKSWKGVHFRNELNRKFGLVVSEGTHFVDLANWFMGTEPISVTCDGVGVLHHATIIRYKGGGLASISMGSTGTLAYPKELLEALGQGAVVVCDHMLEVRTAGLDAPELEKFAMLNDRDPEVGGEGGLYGWLAKRRAACERAERAGDPMLQFTAEPDKGHRRMLQEFVREIRGEREPVSPISSGILALRVCLAAAKSCEERRHVAVDEIPKCLQ